MNFYTAFRGSRYTFHSNEIVLAFQNGYNKTSVCVSGKRLSFAADDSIHDSFVIMSGEIKCSFHSRLIFC